LHLGLAWPTKSRDSTPHAEPFLYETMVTPSKIVCVGRNYLEHARELGNDVPAEPLLFFKPPSSLIATGDSIVLPPQSQQVEYEGEIGVVIGARMKHVDEATAARGVGGLCALNDVTARDLQKSDGQWARAKGFDTFCAVGPVYSGDRSALDAIEVVTRVNGVERQRGVSAQMAFSIAFLLSYISRIMTLEPGDLVATGTPAGVGRLSPGDIVRVELTGLSAVENPVRAP
jgi:2-keto-4-pentenoate hydratase/2-oxohepta-3-ene-1,7-dioic acid hydratase in catechol pathway